MATVGIRQLKNRLSEFLQRVRNGERVTVTDRGKPIAVISPPIEAPENPAIATMIRKGLARWAGGKPLILHGQYDSREADRPDRHRGSTLIPYLDTSALLKA